MKKKRRLLSIILIAVMALAGCGASEETGKEEAGTPVTEIMQSCRSFIGRAFIVTPQEARQLDADTVILPEEDTDPYFTIEEINDEIIGTINGKSFNETGAVSLEDLRYLRVLHVDFDGQTRIGELIVNKRAADDTIEVFRELYARGYQIRKMVLVDHYYDIEMEQYASLDRGNQADCVSIEYDNTSAFNYRVASTGSGKLSNHAYGYAIDFNPYENPYVNADGTLDGPDGSAEYMDRSIASPENHMLSDGDVAVTIFKNHGFSWGGNWSGDKDYQHFDYER
jgi:hypothetical protein